MVTAAQENTAVHRVIELASHLFSSDSLKDSWVPWTESSLLCPLPAPQPATRLAVQSERTSNFSNSLSAWHGIIATSLCPLQPTLNFLVLLHVLQPCCRLMCPELYWPNQRPPSSSRPTDHPFLCFHSDCSTSPGHSHSFFGRSFNKRSFHTCYILSALLRSGGTTVKVVSRALAFMELKKSEQTYRCGEGATMGKS